MPKKIEDVVVPVKKKSIRDIPIPEGRRRAASAMAASLPKKRPVQITEDVVRPAVAHQAEEVAVIAEETVETPSATLENLAGVTRRRSTRKFIWTSVGAGVVIFVFAILSLFAGGTLTYTPKSTPLAFAGNIYSASKTGAGKLLYSVVKLSGQDGQQVAASGEQDVARKASGTVVLYNNADTKPLKLAENTRIETADGKIYKIKGSVTIPAKKTVNGVTQPGSVEAVAVADVAGAEYNIDLSDFVFTGFKNNPAYAKTVYARSKTAMTGGFQGKEKIVNPEELAQAKTLLETELKADLIAQARAQVPEDFILFPNLTSITYSDLPQTVAPDGSALVNIQGELYGVMFKKSDLARYLASEKTVVAENELVTIEGLENLDISFRGAPPADLLKSEQINFEVTGNAVAIWVTDEAALKQDLMGKDKRDIISILSRYPSVASASSVLRPFWKKNFPSDPTEITLKVLPPQE